MVSFKCIFNIDKITCFDVLENAGCYIILEGNFIYLFLHKRSKMQKEDQREGWKHNESL